MKELPMRKHPRLEGYDYSQNGAYFITFCVKDMRAMLGQIVGRGILDAPYVRLSENGKNVVQSIKFSDKQNHEITVAKYVVMPNHVHLLVIINDLSCGASGMPRPTNNALTCGASGMPRPTNAVIPKLISSIKRFSNRRADLNLWQRSYYDHIVRDEAEYQQIWQYIDENPVKWAEDRYYRE